MGETLQSHRQIVSEDSEAGPAFYSAGIGANENTGPLVETPFQDSNT